MKLLTHYYYILLAIATALILPFVLSSGSLASELLIFALAALGCNLLLGYTGLMSFGQGIFFGLGSYAAGLSLLYLRVPLLVALMAAVVLGAVAAAAVGWIAIRRRGIYFSLLTLALGQMFYFLAYTLRDITGGDNGLLNIPRPSISVFNITLLPNETQWQYYSFIAIVFVVAFALLQRAVDSVLGRTLLAIRDNEARAAALGYNVKFFKLVAFTLSGAITGLAGALYAVLIGVAPLESIQLQASESILIMTVIGGTGNLFASVLGAGLYVLAGDWFSTLWPRWLMLLGILLIVVSLYMQKGLWGLGAQLVERVKSIPIRKARSDIKQERNP